jgi:hypothetical protein
MADATVVMNSDLAIQIANLNTLLSQLVQFTSHVSTGAMTAHVLEWLKVRPGLSKMWALLSDRGKVTAGFIAAALPAAGITFTFYHPADQPNTYGVIFSGLTAVTLSKFGWSLLQNWWAQQAYYASVIRAKAVTGVPHVEGARVEPPAPVVVTTGRNP